MSTGLQDNQKRAIEETEEKKKHLRELRKQNVERLKQGKAPVFVPRAELKKAELVDKFLTLKDSGKMDKFMKKKLKSKKNKQEIPTW